MRQRSLNPLLSLREEEEQDEVQKVVAAVSVSLSIRPERRGWTQEMNNEGHDESRKEDQVISHVFFDFFLLDSGFFSEEYSEKEGSGGMKGGGSALEFE